MILVHIEGIRGDCKVARYKDYFFAENISFGVGRRVEVMKKGGGRDLETGKGEPQELTIDKSIDTASIDLMYCSMKDRSDSGAPKLLTVKIDFVQTADMNTEKGMNSFFKIRLGEALIKSWSVSGDTDGRPQESVVVAFNQAAAVYKASSDGFKTFQTFGPKGWDQQKSVDWKPGEWQNKVE